VSWLKNFTVFCTLFFMGLLFPIRAEGYGEKGSTGIKLYRNFSPADYDHQEQNWSVVQDKRGVIYVGNQGALMEFDGLSWRLIYIPNLTVRSLAIDAQDTIYVGGNNEIGFLTLLNGRRQYVSLMNYLKDDERNFGNVWSTHSTTKGIYFRSSNLLIRWDPKARAMKIWRSGKIFNGAFECQGKLFIRQDEIGLQQMVNDSLVLVPGGERFADQKVYMVVPYGTGYRTLLIGTRADGFYVYDFKRAVPFPTQVDAYLTENQVYHGIRLSSVPGNFALATLRGGVVVMDSQGTLKYRFTKADGLLDNNVKYVFEDSQGNLWLALNKGLSKIEYHSPISIHDDRSNLPGIVLSVIKHTYEAKDALYAGTTDGLYVLPPGAAIFQPVPGISSGCWSLVSRGESVLAATSTGVFQIRSDIHDKIIEDTSYALLRSEQDHNRIWVGTNRGLAALHKKDNSPQWSLEHRFDRINQEIKTIAEDPKGTLWLGLAQEGILKVDFSPDETIFQPDVIRYDISHRHPNKENKVFNAAGHVIFTTRRGIFRFDESKNTFIPDNTLGKRFASGSSNAEPVFYIVEGKDKYIWFHSAAMNFQAVPEANSTFKIDSTPFRRIPLTQVNSIYPDPDGVTLWFASNNGLIRYDKTVGKEKNYHYGFSTLIREVWVNGTPLMYDRENFNYKMDKPAFTPAAPLPVIDYKDRNLRFEFAAPFFEAESETHYRWLLEGYDEKWSAWSSEPRKDYTNLNAGQYRFRVQSRNVYHHIGGEAVFQFKVLPPWYRTWWAYSLYGAAVLLLMFQVVRWRSGKLQREKRKLEKTVKERTREINMKNLQLEKQTVQLKEQSEKLKEMDRVKSRFFANISHEFRTPLTLIMGPLEHMISASSDDRQKKEMNVMLRNSQRLLTLINQLLDLSRFDSGKMRLQASPQDIISFLKGITASFELLARQNKLELTFITEEERNLLYFDPEKLEEVFFNLLLNAVKFTLPGGKITVSVKCIKTGLNDTGSLTDPGFVRISVRDTGIGISKDQLIHIFDRFYQAESSQRLRHDQKGTGIGLALTQEIVTLHHGKIDVHSREGEGTEFIILLPLGHAHLKTEEIVERTEPASRFTRAGQITELYGVKEEEKVPDAEEAAKEVEDAESRNVILVVEDNAEMRTYIREPLESLYRVVEAADGKEGIEKARELIPDLIISDIMMPEIDGYQLCGTLKKDIKTSHIPIIMLTAKASEQSIVRGLETGADDYITKPFSTRILMTRIKNLIELRRQLQLKIQRQKMLLPAEISVSSLDDKFLKEFQDIIGKNLSDPEFNIDAMCKTLYMGRTTLFRKVQALTGETPNQFIQSYRLERAAQLLKANFGNITEVAFEVGFSNSAYFTKCFKEKFHQLPSTFQASEARSPKNTY
jgi:signal transduction histidine kinase/DNA-binding response OmpR family regulator